MQRKTWTANVALFILAIAVSLVIGEGIATLLSIYYYPRLIESNDRFGWKYRSTDNPIQRTYVAVDMLPISYSIMINELGFRDQEFDDLSDLRIMILGDSFTFGMEVDQQDIFTTLLEERLRERFDTLSIDVMNFGITGYSMSQEYLVMQDFIDVYKPQVVVEVIFEGNDFDDNVKFFRSGRFSPHYVLQGDNLVFVDKSSWLNSVLGFLKDRSTLYAFLDIRIMSIEQGYDIEKAGKIELATALLKKMNELARRTDSKFLIVYLKEPVMDEAFVDGVRRVAQDIGIEMIVIPLISEERVGGDGHWNARGHARAAVAIERALVRPGYIGVPDD